MLVAAALAMLAAPLTKPAAADESNGPAITVTGEASSRFAPDLAVISVAVETTAATARAAAGENAAKAARIIEALKGLVGPGGEVSTSSYSITPEYEERKIFSGIPEIIGYRATNRVTARTAAIDRAGEMIDRAVSAGANRVDRLAFILSDPEKACDELIKEASGRARSVAEATAREFGVTVAGVESIRPSCGTGAMPVAAFSMRLAEAATPVEPGGIEVRATVEAEFSLK